jgi:5-bromo-4-chloroindolyl phosphate hydrolysis protein
MKATKIKMKQGRENSKSLMEVESIYINGKGNEKYYRKDKIYDFVKENPGMIQVDIYPYRDIIPVLKDDEKYVKSSIYESSNDNLLSLPRE